ncbi:glycosyltransferase family 2 protein [Patescibacteria group bacterium]|nr:glycosyltransferase family 2 protein [Patescibacteria group bacterium]MBU1472767.1 glycosyltransferase family 2 protein [Patescibacteria group bacterium]MBU2460033.1 glycosyltransferase family 2 protein [Patescibacteria group bacterium]MBU2544309.1 glycosyltransferase family 2 protein [Patescibacteria group bacterium]
MNTLSVIIPVYNEEKTIGEILLRVTRLRLSGWTKEIIVIDDGSTDKTRLLLEKWEKKVTVIYKKKNEGKGSAVSIGLSKATGEIILIQDADLEYSPEDYPALLTPFENSKINIVYGSRFLGPHLSTMFLYALGNKFVTFVTNILYNTNITDMETGYKVFRREILEKIIPIKAKSFDFEPEFTAKVLRFGYQIYEVPISYFGRKFSEGKKLTWRDGVQALWILLKYRLIL